MRIGTKIIVRGTVQGIFFRNFCKENADKFDIKGFVRNLEDGDVELSVEGDNGLMQQFIEEIKKGPPHSYIRDVKIEEKKWTGDFKEFKILKF